MNKVGNDGQCHNPAASLRAITIAVMTLMLSLGFYNAALAVGPPPVQHYYVPLPEDQIYHALKTIYPNSQICTPAADVANPINTYISLSVISANTIIYYDVLVHLDDTFHENGEIRFLAGSHKAGALTHITQTEAGPCSPHLPTDQYKLEETVPVSAKRGDVVVFSINTIHGSYINTTKQPRRMVRVGYRDPQNQQTRGQSFGRPGLIVQGYRNRREGQPLFKQD